MTPRRRQGRPIYEVEHSTLRDCLDYFEGLKLKGAKAEIGDKVIREISSRLRFLNDVGLNYLSLDRSADTLSGGEAQRIRLASQIGSGLTGVMYVLDEPSIGLHQRDNDRLIATLRRLRDLGNTVIVVEHDEDAIRAADYVLDLGPGAGVHGGRIMSQGTPDQVAADPASLTGRYLSGAACIEVPRERHRVPATAVHKSLKIVNARGNNLKGVTVEIPVGLLTCVTGVSGSARAPWSMTRSTRPWPRSSTKVMRTRRRMMRSRASMLSTRSSTSTRARSAARRAPTRPPTPVCSRPSASSSLR